MFLLDTHVVVWTALDPGKLSRPAARAMEDAWERGAGLFIVDVTLCEIAVLVQRKRIWIRVSLESFLEEVEKRFSVLPVDRHMAARSVQLPDPYPKDPIDRLIGAAAIVQQLPLITADERIRGSKLFETIW